MKTETLSPFPPNTDPFVHDLENMGTVIGVNCMVMFKNHKNETCRFVIIVNTETGERIKVTLKDE